MPKQEFEVDTFADIAMNNAKYLIQQVDTGRMTKKAARKRFRQVFGEDAEMPTELFDDVKFDQTQVNRVV